jgi:hypothetical protein
MYNENEKTSEVDHSCELGQVMLYLQTPRKLVSTRLSCKNRDRHDQCIVEFGLWDYYFEKGSELVKIGACNYIVNDEP